MTFSAYYVLLFQEKVKMHLKCKKIKRICTVYGEGAVPYEHVKSSLQSFMLENAAWSGRLG